MASTKRAESAQSSSSNELIDRQLNEMLINNEQNKLPMNIGGNSDDRRLQRGRRKRVQVVDKTRPGRSSNDEDNKTPSVDIDNNNSNDLEQNDDVSQSDACENVAVMVRCRPLQIAATDTGGGGGGGRISGSASSTTHQASSNSGRKLQVAVEADEQNKCIQVSERQFYFDQVFGTNCDNEQVYMRSARRLVECAFRGYNCTIFLYGQTGTGKTYTHSSLTLSSFEHLFSLIQDSSKSMSFLIRASYYELYNEEIHDLLAPQTGGGGGGGRKRSTKGSGGVDSRKSLELRESKERGVYVKDLTCFLVNNLTELNKLKKLGDRRRTTASTQMNEHSSRSHSIFTITIETIGSSNNCERLALTKNKQQQQQPVIRVGHLNLIDLAGSERQSKSGSSGLRMKEASQINLSLTCLSLVIRALTDADGAGAAAGAAAGGKRHVPYRNSKLTRLLSSSLGGNSKTILIACISVAASNLDETLNTLRFASRTKQIKNTAAINEDPKDALLRKYRRQLNELKQKLSEQQQQQRQRRQRSSNLDRRSSGNRDDDFNGDDDDDDGARLEQIRLNQQLELLKAKIMFGGENLLDKLELHERLIEASKLELEERRREEAKLRDKLNNKKQTIEQVVQSKGSLESQLEYLDSKLNRAIGLYKSSKLELKDLSSEHELLKEQLLQTIKSTSKEIKYVDCIIEDFIPRKHLDLLNAYAQYDEESDQWQIKYIALSGNNIAQTRRLISRLSAVTANDDDNDATAAGNDQSGSNHQATNDSKLQVTRRRGQKLRAADTENNNRPDPFIRL